MKEIRIQKVYDGHGGNTYINLKQIAKGLVEYRESFYPSINSRAIESDPITITSAKANAIFMELKKTAAPYIRYNQDGMFEKMK